MIGDPAAPPLTVESPRAGVRPHAWVRRLSRALFAMLTATFTAMMALSWLYPGGASRTPSWVGLSLGVSFLASMAVAAAALLTQVACWVGPLTGATLSADPEGLRVGKRLIPPGAVESAWTLREPDGARVELRLADGNVFSASVPTAEQADALLDAAGVDPSRRAMRMPLGGALSRLGVGLAAAVPASCVSSMVAAAVGGALHLPSASLGFLIFALFTLCLGAAVRYLSPPEVAVGRDGLSVRGGTSSWFVPFDQIEHVVYGRNEVMLWLRDRTTRRISTLATTAARRDALHARLAAALESSRTPLDLSTRLAALDRNGRSPDEWRASLKCLAHARDGFRFSGLSREEVQAALSDPHTTPERRIGAAYALSAMDPEQGGAHVRIAAETVAHEPVRVAMERAAEGELDEAALEAARAGR